MPQDKPRTMYSVHSSGYKTQEIKEAVERGTLQITSPDQIGGSLWYLGTDERTASRRFYLACKEAMQNSLIVKVQVERGTPSIDTIVQVWARAGFGLKRG